MTKPQLKLVPKKTKLTDPKNKKGREELAELNKADKAKIVQLQELIARKMKEPKNAKKAAEIISKMLEEVSKKTG